MVKVICVLEIAISEAPSRISAAGWRSDSQISAKARRGVPGSGFVAGRCAMRRCWPSAEMKTVTAMMIAPHRP